MADKTEPRALVHNSPVRTVWSVLSGQTLQPCPLGYSSNGFRHTRNITSLSWIFKKSFRFDVKNQTVSAEKVSDLHCAGTLRTTVGYAPNLQYCGDSDFPPYIPAGS